MCQRVEIGVVLEQGEADLGELAAQCDEGGRGAQAAITQSEVVRFPQRVAPGLHGGVEQQTPDLPITLVIDANPHGVIAKEIPGGRCARIRHFGTREYMAEADYIYREWLPASGEQLRDFPPFFHYVNVGPDVRDEDMITDIYLPLE